MSVPKRRIVLAAPASEEQHVVIFRATATELRIARILHIRRDIDAELID